jgi:hypothetical protein
MTAPWTPMPVARRMEGQFRAGTQEKDPFSPRDETYRVPRTVVDLISARPIHLAIIDGINLTLAAPAAAAIGIASAPSPPDSFASYATRALLRKARRCA